MIKSIKTTNDASPRSGPSPRSAYEGQATNIKQHKTGRVLSKRKKEVLKLTILLVLLVSSFLVHSQNLPFPSQNGTLCLSGNTGATISGSGPITTGNTDPKWLVCQNLNNPNWLPARVMNPISNMNPTVCLNWANASGNVPQPNYAKWITHPNYNCTQLGNYSCGGGSSDLYFKLNFTFTQPTNYVLDWNMNASDWIEDITINGVYAYKANSTPTWHPNHQISGVHIRWCWNWVVTTGTVNAAGNNIIVHVKMAPGLPGACQNAGLKIEAGCGTYAAITGPLYLCKGTLGTYTSTPKTAITPTIPSSSTYSWSINSGWGLSWNGSSNVSTVTAASYSGALLSCSYYTMNPSGYKDCLASAIYSITTPGAITITPSSTAVCVGTNLNLTASGATGYWWLAPSMSGPVIIGTGPSINIMPVAGLTTYTVTGMAPIGGCSLSQTVQITGKPKPVVTISASTTQVCAGKPVLLSINSSAFPLLTYLNPPGSSIFGPTTLTLIPTANTVYNAVTTGSNGCTANASVGVTVNPLPTINVVASPSSICAGDPTTITATSPGATSWSWSPLSNSTATLMLNVYANTTYSATATTSSGCSKTGTAQVKIIAPPVVVAFPQSICVGWTNTLSASGAATYTWYVNDGITTNTISNTPTIALTPTSVISYTVCGTASNNTCTACYSNSLGFAPVTQISANPTVNLCTNGGNCVNVSATSTNAGASFTWQPTGQVGGTVAICPTTNTTVVVTVSTPSTCPSSATVAVSIVTNCCLSSTAGLSVLPATTGLGGLYANGSYLLDASTTLSVNTTFSNCEVWITPGVEISVPNSMYLSLDKAHLFACGGNMWKGITVQDGGRVITPPINARSYSSLIEDAETAIDIASISYTNTGSVPPLDIQRVIFNRNFVGIHLANSDPMLDSLAVGINGCIFTSRQFTYTTYPSTVLTWPNSEYNCTLGGLRCANLPTTGIVAPYTFPGFPIIPLKNPHTSQPGHIGIKIENIGNPTGIHPSSGIQFGITYPGPITNDFNLFDGIGVGIEVTDASLTTKNNVFQNTQYYNYAPSQSGAYGGQGIKHVITGIMNAKISLKGTSLDDGNRFWDCPTGIYASNVFDHFIRFASFRSDHQAPFALNPQPMPGDTGISIYTNRFDIGIHESQFNNLKFGIVFNTPTVITNYDIGTGTLSGICASAIDIEHDYFGPLPTSTAAYTGNNPNMSEYMGDAIQLNTPITAGWAFGNHSSTFSLAPQSVIAGNKINRTFRGILVNGMENTPLAVSGNSISVENDFTFSGSPTVEATGYGIAIMNNLDNMAVQFNTVQAETNWNQPPTDHSVALIYSTNNYGTVVSPRIECNSVSEGYFGFQFEGNNPNTVWEGNMMCDNFGGMALTHSAVIGQQGSPTLGSGNVWSMNCSPWGQFFSNALWQTYCDDSDPTQSPLYVVNTPGWNPTINMNAPLSSFPYPFYTMNNIPAIGQSLFDISPVTVNRLFDCVGNSPYLTPPAWRTANTSTGLKEDTAFGLNLYPNPTDGKLTLVNSDTNTDYEVSIRDITGRLAILETVKAGAEINLDIKGLRAAIYIVEIKNQQGKSQYKKLIKTN